MVIYIEYALAENFLIDGLLLWLALKAAKQKTTCWRIVLAAAIGAGFAVAFPLLKLAKPFSYILKFSVGALLCLIAAAGKGGGRVALTVVLFFGFSFALGGALIALFSAFSVEYKAAGNGYFVKNVPVGGLLAGSTAFGVGSVRLIKRLYRQKMLSRFVYPCRVTAGTRSVRADGFLDSGNSAKKDGIPVCFITPDLAYDLTGGAPFTEETTIRTVNGEKTIKIFLADSLEIYCGKGANIIKRVYFSPSVHIRARGYKIILNAAAAETLDGSGQAEAKTHENL